MSPLELSAKAQDVIRKIEKLLAIANDERANENLAAAAAAKAQELLEAYNLDMAVIGANGNGQAVREDARMKGGLYQWQRNLWYAAARLNFCYYWTIRGTYKGQKFQHRLVGRQENVIGARLMAEYLQDTVERLAQERAKQHDMNVFERRMIAYREGLAARLYQRLNERRYEKLEVERREQAARRAQQQPTAPAGTHAVVLSTYIETEDDANSDFLYGRPAGYTAQQRAEREARMRAAEEEAARLLRERQAYLAAHPAEAEKVRKQEEAEARRDARREARRHGRYRRPTDAERRAWTSDYGTGYEHGDDISLDQQVDRGSDRKRIR